MLDIILLHKLRQIMATFEESFFVIFLRMFIIFICVNAPPYSCNAIWAAPILVQEGVVNQSSANAWFEEANASIITDVSRENELNQTSSEPEDSTRSTYRPTTTAHGRYISKRTSYVSLEDGQYGEESSLKHLLRSYLNTSPSATNGLMTKPQDSHLGSSAIFLDESNKSNEFVTTTKNAAEDFLTKTVNFVLQPGVSENNLMTFSIFGIGEFALLSGKDGLFLSFGDMYISLFSNNFETLANAGSGVEYGTIAANGSNMGNNSSIQTGTAGTPTHTAYYESKDPNDADEMFSSEGQSYNKGPTYRRMFDLILDILTYPVTLIIILGWLLFNFVKSKGGFRIKKTRQYSTRSKHHRSRLHKKRTAEK